MLSAAATATATATTAATAATAAPGGAVLRLQQRIQRAFLGHRQDWRCDSGCCRRSGGLPRQPSGQQRWCSAVRRLHACCIWYAITQPQEPRLLCVLSSSLMPDVPTPDLLKLFIDSTHACVLNSTFVLPAMLMSLLQHSCPYSCKTPLPELAHSPSRWCC